MLARRMLLFAVVLLMVTAISAALAPPPRTGAPAPASPTASPAADGTVVERTIDADRTRPQTVVVQAGDILTLTIEAQTMDAVELQGLAALRAIDPDTPVVFDVLPEEAGDYPVLLHGGDGVARTIGTVRVVSPQE
jgi:hypothetical protein